MPDYNKILDIFDNQIECEVIGDYPDIIYNVEIKNNEVIIKLKNQDIGFVFDYISGNLKYIYNWKE